MAKVTENRGSHLQIKDCVLLKLSVVLPPLFLTKVTERPRPYCYVFLKGWLVGSVSPSHILDMAIVTPTHDYSMVPVSDRSHR